MRRGGEWGLVSSCTVTVFDVFAGGVMYLTFLKPRNLYGFLYGFSVRFGCGV